MNKRAFAVYDTKAKEIFANSVHDTAQGAMVNGLLLIFGFITPQAWQYPLIRSKWVAETNGSQFTIVGVLIGTDGKEVKV